MPKAYQGPYPVFVPASEQDVIYVGKHGNDANSGLNVQNAKLTIQAAITQAVTNGAAVGNEYVVKVTDSGIYDEALTLAAYVHIDAPFARLIKSSAAGNVITAVANTSVICGWIDVITAQIGYVKNNAGDAWFKVLNEAVAVGSGIVVLNIAAGSDLYYEYSKMTIENGFGVGDIISNPTGHTHVIGGGNYITGTGTMFIGAVGGAIRGRIDNIEQDGVGPSTAINASTCTIELVIAGEVDTDVMFLVGTGGELHLYCPHFDGTGTITGTGNAEIHGHSLNNITLSNTADLDFYGEIDGNVVLNNTATMRLFGDIGTDLTLAAGTSLIQQGTSPPAGTITAPAGTYQLTTPRLARMMAGPGTVRTVNGYAILTTDVVPHDIDASAGIVRPLLPVAATWIATNPDLPFIRANVTDMTFAAGLTPQAGEQINLGGVGVAKDFGTVFDSWDLYPVAGVGWVIR